MNTNVKIGIELHLKPNLDKKLFCYCLSKDSGKLNEYSCEICRGEPGTYPILNKEAIELGIKLGQLLNMNVSDRFEFVRKHYVYRDLPKGYQISMLDNPLATGGQINIYHNYTRINSVKLSKLILQQDPCSYKNGKINYNRSGTPLFELVSEPVFTNTDEVTSYIKTVIKLLKYSDILDKKSKKPFRADVNISINNGIRAEIKNIGSIEQIHKVIPVEIQRQKENRIHAIQTRCYNELLNTTEFMRYKQSGIEYLYLNQPNILPILYDKKLRLMYNIYDAYLVLKKYNMSESRTETYIKFPKLVEFITSCSPNEQTFKIIDLMIKYRDYEYEKLNRLVTVEEYLKCISNQWYSNTCKIEFQRAYSNLLNDPTFLQLCKREYIGSKQFAYVVGKLRQATKLNYYEILRELEKKWNSL